MKMAKKWRYATAAFVLGLAVFTLPLWGNAVKDLLHGDSAYAADADGGAEQQHVITVSGQGEMTVDPDVAYITFGVQSEAVAASDAQAANAKTFDQIKRVLTEKYKVDDKDIRSTDFSVQPQYQYKDGEKPKIVGYTAMHNIQVTYRDLENIGKLLDDVSAAGANRVNGIQFGTEKNQEYELQVLNKAMENAKAKGDVLAKFVGKTITDTINISQISGGGSPIVYANFNNELRKMADSAAPASTSISSGQLKISTTVTVQFAF